jgi:hypothetical protein
MLQSTRSTNLGSTVCRLRTSLCQMDPVSPEPTLDPTPRSLHHDSIIRWVPSTTSLVDGQATCNVRCVHQPVHPICSAIHGCVYTRLGTLTTYSIFSHICLYTNSGCFDVLNTGFFCTSPLCQIASMATHDTQKIKYPVSSVEVTADTWKLIETGDWHPRSL